MSNQQSLYNELLQKLRSVRRKEQTLNLSGGALRALSISLFVLVLFALVESLAYFGTGIRTLMAFTWLAATVGAFAWFIGPSALRALGIRPTAGEEDIARRVGARYPDVQDRLCNAIQLYHQSNEQRGASAELALAGFSAVGEKARALDFEVILDRERTKKGLMYFAAALVAGTLSFGVFSGPVEALSRLAAFNEAFIPPAPYSLRIEPLQHKALRGENISIQVFVDGTQQPDNVVLRLREDRQEEFDSYTLRPDSNGVYRYEITAIKRGVEFYAESPWYIDYVRTPIGSISVFDKPDIRALSGAVVPPAYTRQPSRTLDESSADIVALRGSAVNLNIIANKDLAKAEIVILKRLSPAAVEAGMTDGQDSSSAVAVATVDTSVVAMKVAGRRAEGSFTVRELGNYYIRITDTDGENNPEPISYSIVPLSDADPTISLIEPTFDVELSENAILPVKVVISDDYGFSALKLKYKLIESEYSSPDKEFKSIDLFVPRGERAAEVPYVWDLNQIGITPSDKYQFFVEVFDNDVISGPKSARTALISVRLPSLDEVFNEAESSQDVAAKELEKMLKEAEQVSKDIDKVNRELMKQERKDKVEWKEQQKIKDIMQKQAEFAQKLDDIRKDMEDMTQKLQDRQAISQETLEKYKELQELLKEVNSEDLQKAMKRMEQAMEQMTPEQMRKAMENFEFNEEQFRKSVERTMKVLKRLQAEQKTDELTKRAEDLKQKQEDLQKQAENTNPNDKQKREDLAKKQEQLNKELNDLDKELSDLEELMKDIGEDMPMEEMEKAVEELQKQQTEMAMKQAQQQMQQGEMKQAQKSQKQAQKNLDQFAQQMQKLKKEMQKNAKEEAMRQMRKAIQNMLELSQRQEQMKESAGSMNHNSAQLRDLAQQQADAMEDLRNIANNLAKLSEKTFAVSSEMGKEMGEALNKMQNAISQLSERNPSAGAGQQSQAMGNMNRATQMMQDALGQMQGQNEGQCDNPGQGQGQGQGQQGFMQSLQQAAMQQQMVNQALQQMMQQQGGGKLSQEQRGKMERLSKEQGEIGKSVEELAKEQKESGGQKKALGDLEKMAQEIKEIVADMQSGKLDEETLRRQERILSRLLDATRSTRERDYEKERESRSADNLARRSPADIDMLSQEGRARALQDLLRSVQQGYTKDYEGIIRKYFEALQKTGGTY